MMIEQDAVQTRDCPQIVRAARKNPAAFAELYNWFAKDIYRYLYSRVRDQADAEDLTAQTFLTVLEKLPSYRERGRFKAWLFTIAHNKLMDFFQRNPAEVLLDPVAMPGEQNTLLADVIQTEEIQQLSALIQDLDEDEQELLRLRYVAELSFTDMAHILGKRKDTVKKSLYRLQARLQTLMEVKNG